MLNIPKKAMPVVEVLRRDVPRPDEMPLMMWKNLRWRQSKGYCCPMGLHQWARHPAPTTSASFPVDGVSFQAVESFGDWWDSQTDAQAAMDAVWPQ